MRHEPAVFSFVLAMVRNTEDAEDVVQRASMTFAQPITTSKLRIEVELHEELSGAMLACRFNAEIPAPTKPFIDPDKELQRIKKEAQQTLTADVDEFNGYSHLNGNRPEFDGWRLKVYFKT